MSASRMEDYLNGRLDHSDLNKEDIEAYVKAQKQALADAKTPSSSAPPVDPLGARDVHSQAKQDSKDPITKKQKSFLPASKPSMFSGSDKSAANSLRTILGPNPFSTIPSFGKARYIPNATMYSVAWMETDRLMANTPKFVDAATFWHPLVSRYYGSLLWFLSVFRSMQSAGELSEDLDIFLTDLFKRYPADSWPVPGPMVPFLTSLASSSPLLDQYQDIVPWLPDLAPITQSNHYLPNNNLAGRIPLPHILLDQVRKFISFCDPDKASPTTDAQCARWKHFLEELFKTSPVKMFKDKSATNTDKFDNAYDNGEFVDTAKNDLYGSVVCSPFMQSGFHVTTRGIKQFRDNILEMTALFPETLSIPTTRASTAANTWQTILCLQTTKHVPVLLSNMAVYCRHLSASVSLAEIIPVGHTAGQVKCELTNKFNPATYTGRFPDLDYTFRAYCQNNQLPSADLADSVISAVNLSAFAANAANTITRSTAVQSVFKGNLDHRIAGPYFYKLPNVLRTNDNDPCAGYSSVIASEYHSQTPIRSANPN